jgi:sortase A
LFQAIATRHFNFVESASSARTRFANPNRATGNFKGLDEPIRNDSLIGKLKIDRLGISVIVLEGVEDGTLRLAAGHVPDTALPGQFGNVAIAAHRDTFFRPLRNIRTGDKITLETPKGSYEYKVDATWIVNPEHVGVLNPTPYPELTLITCYPFYFVGNAPDRFIVRARQITPQPSPAAISKDIGNS